VPHAPPGKRALYAIAVSPNVNGSCEPSPSLSALGIVDVLTEPAARGCMPPLIKVAEPQADPSQVRMEIVGTVPPLERS